MRHVLEIIAWHVPAHCGGLGMDWGLNSYCGTSFVLSFLIAKIGMIEAPTCLLVLL